MGFVVDKVALGQVFLRFFRQYHFTVGSTFPKIKKKKFLSFIHSPLHSSSSGDGQKARKSGSSPVRHQSHPHNQNRLKVLNASKKNNLLLYLGYRWKYVHMNSENWSFIKHLVS
jgi:hypothetical protein